MSNRWISIITYTVLAIMAISLIAILVTSGKVFFWVQTWVTFLGLSFIVMGFHYDKKVHKESKHTSGYGFNLWGFIVGVILNYLPWWVSKAFWILLGLAILAFAVFVLILS